MLEVGQEAQHAVLCYPKSLECCLGCAVRGAEPLHHALAVFLDYTDENKTAVSEPVFTNALIQLYSCSNHTRGAAAYCQLTHVYLPRQTVVASHLWKRAWNRCNKLLKVCWSTLKVLGPHTQRFLQCEALGWSRRHQFFTQWAAAFPSN